MGFTIVELLIVIVVIAILAAISIVAYNGIQARANDSKRASDIRQVAKLIELYYATNGSYPSTGSLNTTYADSNCTNSNPNKRADWVPDLDASLPQSFGPLISSSHGCYLYASNGTSYLLSAWRAVQTGPQTSLMYRRFGFREAAHSANDAYHCNTNPANNAYWENYYQYSYTVSNITTCNESI